MKQSVYRKTFFYSLMTVIFAGWASITSAHDYDAEPQVVVTGQGEVTVAPDLAVIRLGVSDRSANARMAMDAVSDAVERLMQRLDKHGVSRSDVQTGQIMLQPVRNQPDRDDDTLQGFDSFDARNMLVITVRDLSMLGTVLQDMVDDGANQISSVRFDLSDRGAAEAQARQLAVSDARTRAEGLAEAAGTELSKILEITEQGSHIAAPRAAAAEMGRANAVPIAPGQLTVSVHVMIRYGIQQ